MDTITKEFNSPVMIFKCPGSHEVDGIKYDYNIINDGDDIDSGWYKTIAEAYEAARTERSNRRSVTNEKA